MNILTRMLVYIHVLINDYGTTSELLHQVSYQR